MDRSPYAPPDALAGAAVYEGGGPDPLLPTDRVDVGAAFSFPFATPDWWKTCVAAGVFTFLPLVGVVALTGWMRDIHDRVREGRPGELPAYAFSTHLDRGWRAFGGRVFTLMTLYLVLFAAGLVAVLFSPVLVEALGDAGEFLALMILGFSHLFLVFVSLVYSAYKGEVDRLAFRGELFPLAHLRQSIRAVRAAPAAYGTTILGLFLANLLLLTVCSALCFVGVLLTLPTAWAIMAHLTGQWARVVDHTMGAEP